MFDAVTRLNAALEGRYAIERELGEGGMVDQARHLALLWCCAFPLVATACGGESPTEGTVVEVVEGSLLSVAGECYQPHSPRASRHR